MPLTAAQQIEMQTGAPAQWAGLSRHLIARIFPVDFEGKELPDSPSVFAPITDTTLDAQFGWQSPFENTGSEAKLPSLMAMVQSGSIGTYLNMIQASGFIDPEGKLGSLINEGVERAKKVASELRGRTGVTRLNSRQCYASSTPLKLSMTMHFRAMSDPQAEVVEPYLRLMEWAHPKRLAKDGSLAEGLKDQSVLSALFPSEAPQMVGFTYAGFRYSPMVIEHISNPVDGAMDADGNPLHRAIQVQLATLTALDKGDMRSIFVR